MLDEKLIEFIRKNAEHKLTIGNNATAVKALDFVLSSVKLHSPSNVLIIGAVKEITLAIAPFVRIVVILEEDESLALKFAGDMPKNVKVICGRATDLPVDYNVIDMAICVDYLDLYDSSRLIDELKRSIEYEGLFLIAGRVCANTDLDGVYDELYRTLNPFHNDYYLVDDLKTILSLKELAFVNDSTFTFTTDMASFAASMDQISGESRAEKMKIFIDDNQESLKTIYKLNNTSIEEHYFAGLFRRLKPEFEDYEEEVRRVKKQAGIVE
jgi:hypothetical protein